MEIIKNYLESMFASLPNTEQVIKAKTELLCMMEDKYNELIQNGESQNSAVGTVISEFGNLDELAEALGISGEVSQTNEYQQNNPSRFVSCEEAKEYVAARTKYGFWTGIAVMLCICCTTGPILGDALRLPEVVGVLLLFSFIGVAVGLFIYSGNMFSKWKYIHKERCQIDMMTVGYLANERKNYAPTHSVRKTVGIVLCAICWVGAAVLGSTHVPMLEELSGIALFIMVGVGVFLIISSGSRNKAYDELLKTNDVSTISGNYIQEQQEEYKSPVGQLVMELFWPVVTCIYLTTSFITFSWGLTWIIWPVAAGTFVILRAILRKNEE